MSKPLTLDRLLYTARRFGASDIHLIAGLPPAWRVNGEIVLAEAEPYSAETLARLALDALTEAQRETFEKEMALSYSLTHSELGRFRVSVYLRNGSPGTLHPRLRGKAAHPRGARAAGGGRPAARPALRPHSRHRADRFRQDDDAELHDRPDQQPAPRQDHHDRRPIEYVHTHKMSLVVQQELHSDVRSFHEGLLHILRQDPDVIGIGEMRNFDTIGTALTAAETGHLVIATLHTSSVVTTVERIVGVFPSEQQQQVIVQLANSLQGILTQQLLPTVDRKGRVLACEYLSVDLASRNLMRDADWHKLYTQLELGTQQGMCTMDSSLIRLYEQGRISYDSLLSHVVYPDTVRRKYNRSGI